VIGDWGDIGTMTAPTAKLLAQISAYGFIAVTKADPVEDFAVALDRASEWALPYAGQLITNIDATTRDTINALVSDTMANPDASLDDLASAITANFADFSDYRAEMIARTETSIAAANGDVAGFRDTGVEYVEISDGTDFDEECSDADGQVWSVDEYEADPSAHPNAVFAGSAFASYGGVLEFRRAAYDGPAIRVRTTDGRVTTIGPNHPMLTSHGMTRAEALAEGDQLVYDLRGDGLSIRPGRVADLQHIPAVENVVEALRSVGSYSVVPCTGDDLHGDGAFCQGEVEVIQTTRELLPEWNACVEEQRSELFLPRTNPDLTPEPSKDAALALHRSVVATASRFVGSLSSEPIEQRSSDGSERNSRPGGETGVGHETVSEFAHLVLLTVASVERLSYVGAAFDCATVTSLYCSDGFVVSNCGRSASAISTDEARERGVDRGDDPPDTPDQPPETALTDLPDTSEVTQDE
jgi:hypothetical protein